MPGARLTGGRRPLKRVLLRAAGQGQGLHGVEHDEGVHAEGHVLDVVEVAFQLGDGIQELAVEGEIHLGPADDAGADAVPLTVVGNMPGKGGDELGALGTGSHERHIPLEHIEELRQVVDAQLAEDRANPGDAGAVFGVELGRNETYKG